VSRDELVRLMCSARICINPHAVSETPGNVFAFKIVEYLAAGAHVITTPMGALEQELEAGITYMPDNSPETIAATLRRVIRERRYERTALGAARQTYGPVAVSRLLDTLLTQVRPTAIKRASVRHAAIGRHQYGK
jgi:glycosyltransferase involved in cell wall biosynthesis